MKLNISIFGKNFKAEALLVKHYKEMLMYIHNKDNIGLCEFIDSITDKSYNVYEKFILMLHLYKICFNEKLTYEKGKSKYIFYLEDIINKLPTVEFEKWIEIDKNMQILVRIPTRFFNKHIDKEAQFTVAEMNEYFVNNCLAAIKIGDAVHELDEKEINELPSFIFNAVVPHIRLLDTSFQRVDIFGEFNLKLSVFSMLSILTFIFNMNEVKLNEFEFVMRRYVHLTNFDEITYKRARDIADIYSHDLQEQRNAIEDAKNQAG